MERTYKQGHFGNGREVTWNPELTESDPSGHNGHFFPIVDKFPTDPNDERRYLSFEYGSVGHYQRTAQDVRDWFARLQQRHPGYDFSKCNARIVKAPCAFDAREHGVLVEAL